MESSNQMTSLNTLVSTPMEQRTERDNSSGQMVVYILVTSRTVSSMATEFSNGQTETSIEDLGGMEYSKERDFFLPLQE